ncbi:MAG: NAD(P)/FAD-dependent oxidoreductase, partial [Lentisphaeria bacterium]|nr:NAD(P)/FAD-dependent oxidoreductase [Lentisphaeria bacterium]
LKSVDPKTLESRLVPKLFFAGEMLDLDGPCGGFNLQWAFASGHLAGHAAGKSVAGE